VVTICPLNPISTQQSLGFTKTVLAGVPLSFIASNSFYITTGYFVTVMASNPALSDSVRQTFGGPLSSTILSCNFNQQPCNMSNFRVNIQLKI
jgi:hypothetical protein